MKSFFYLVAWYPWPMEIRAKNRKDARRRLRRMYQGLPLKGVHLFCSPLESLMAGPDLPKEIYDALKEIL